VAVRALSRQRVAASQVAALYEESQLSMQKREELSTAIKASSIAYESGGRRPNKKERRDRDRLKRSL
jgi:ribosome-associated heat shock protein Hsp15